jgi:site-specific recombinase XerD
MTASRREQAVGIITNFENAAPKTFMDMEILSQKFCEYSVSIKGYSPATIRRYRESIKFYCRMAGVSVIDQVTDENVRNLFYNGRIARKWSVNTFMIYHKSLLVFFRWCVKQGYMEKNPVLDIEVPKHEKRLPIKLTKQDALRLLEIVYNYPYEYKFLRYRNHAIFSTFIFAGLRKQELLHLKFTDIDLENLTLFVRLGKGNRDRIIPISFTLAQTLKRYKDERKRLNKTNAEFFTSLRGNTGFTENGLKKLVEQMRGVLGITFSVHKLRHTFATLMLEGGCDIYSLSRMMGHSDIKTTTIYLSASAEHLRAQMNKHPLN